MVFISIARRSWLGSVVGHENEVFYGQRYQVLPNFVQVSNIHARVIVKWPLVYLLIPVSQKGCASRYPIKQTQKCHEALFCLIVVLVTLGCLAVAEPDFKGKHDDMTANYDAEVPQ